MPPKKRNGKSSKTKTTNLETRKRSRPSSSTKMPSRRSRKVVEIDRYIPVIKRQKRQKTVQSPNGTKTTKESLEILIHGIASQLIGNKTFANKLDSIKELLVCEFGVKIYRKVLVGGSTPDAECAKARGRAKSTNYTSAPAYNYKKLSERMLEGTKININKNVFAKTLIDKRQTTIPFKPTHRGDCGNCWLCGIKVSYYKNKDYVTGCGECEHIGAILASFLTGMLTSADLDLQKYNYGTSHAHCNQRKSNIISMEFKVESGIWTRDSTNIKKLTDEIIVISNERPFHANEYDFDFRKIFANKIKIDKNIFKNEIKSNIEVVTDSWCNAANDSISSVTKISKRKASYELIEKIKNASIGLMMKTKIYRQFDTHIGGGVRTPTLMVVSNDSSHKMNTIEDEFKQIFGESIFDQLDDINNDLKSRANIEFLENLQEARIGSVRFADLNNILRTFTQDMDVEVVPIKNGTSKHRSSNNSIHRISIED